MTKSPAILETMSERILVCDKSIPFAGMVAGELRNKNAAVALVHTAASGEAGSLEASSASAVPALHEISWTRRSQLSAKTVLLETRNTLLSLDNALLVYDAQAFISSLSGELESVPALLDDYIDGYVFLVRELASFFLHQKKGRIFFAIRPFPSRSVLPGSSETVFALAEAAFIRLAEETSAYFSSSGSTHVSCPLIRLGDGDDTEDAAWLADKLADRDTGKLVSRGGSPRWVKAGSRNILGIL